MIRTLSLLALTCLFVPAVSAQETKPAAKPTQEELVKKLTETLTGAKMTGRFTVLGKEEKEPAAEEYTIVSAQKVDGDTWLLKARIKYGKTDTTLPVPLEIKWAGDTPIITMTDMSIPGLGDSFSTRVVIYDGMYSGTWAHGKVKGHLYGTISKATEEKPATEKKE
jgi:hypothetical protein